MEVGEIKQLIAYHENGLAQYRQHMSHAAQYLEEQTIIALKELEEYEVRQNIAAMSMAKAKAILDARKQ